jgi:CRISPR-associated protein Cmr6
LVEAAFAHAFQWLGFGAKTSVGYGAFAPATQSTDITRQPVAPATSPAPREPETDARNETVWRRAQLEYNERNGTMTAIGPNRSRAYAYEERAQDLLSRLPDEIRRRVRARQFVRADARVRGSVLVAVDAITS